MPVTICFFLSGAAALVLQVLWTRMLGHVFGATSLAVSTTLTVFMGGLALGAHLGGKWAPKMRHPLLTFAVLETAVGLFGLLVPTLFGLMPALQKAIGLELGFWGYAVFRFAIVALILLIPTTAMGATLPILAEGTVKRTHQLASKTGRLYASNTFGAVAGAFVGGFLFIPLLGLHHTVYLAAAMDLFVAIAVLILWRIGEGDDLLLKERRPELPDDVLAIIEPVQIANVTRRDQRLALVVFAVSGAAAMALQVFWTRSVGVVIGASTYSFTLIVTTFLVGLAVGCAVISRRVDRIANPVVWLAWTEVIIGCAAIFASLFVDKLPLLLHATAREHDVTLTSIYLTDFFIAALVTLPATLALGAVMPLVIRTLTPHGQAHAGPIVGRAYALNTLGAIIGSFTAGFILLPLIGVQAGLSFAAAINILLGVLLVAHNTDERKRVAIVAVIGIAIAAFGPKWDVRSWASGLFRMYLARSVYRSGWAPSGRVLFHRDGVATSVTVEQQDDGVGISLKVNGKVDASDIGDMPTQILSGLLPVFIHDDPEDVLVIGYGSGVTPGAVLQSDIKTLHVAEIESAVYEAANTHFAHVNNRPWEDPRTKLFVDDGRNFLLTRKKTYDIIISEPSNPWMTGAASLFTVDFFRVAESRLNEGGVFLQWLQLYELSPGNIRSLIRTFASVFPKVMIFTPDPQSNDTLLIGTRDLKKVDLERIEEALKDPKLSKELKRARIESPHDFHGLIIMGPDEIPGFVGEGPINTDDNALIEFSAPKDLLNYSIKDPRLPFIDGIDGTRSKLIEKYYSGYTKNGATMERIANSLLVQSRVADARAFASAANTLGADAHRVLRIVGYIEEDDDEPVVIANKSTYEDEEYARCVYAMMRGRDRDALTLFEMEENLEKRSNAHRFLYAYLTYRLSRELDAEYLMKDVLEDDELLAANPAILYYAGKISVQRGKWRNAIDLLGRFDDAMASERIVTSSVATSKEK